MVDKTGNCWEWVGTRNSKGYGNFTIAFRNNVLSHRYAWEQTHGAIPDGAILCHKCDNPACVRPSHLFLGTKADNNRDMIAKGRHRFGERSHLARLSDTDAKEVLRLSREGWTHKAIAAKFGVSRQTITDLVSGRTWRHLRHPA